MVSTQLKYGVRYGKPEFTHNAKLLASTVLPAKSGRFVVYDISDGYFKAVATSGSYISGYIEESLTASATSGVTVLPLATNVQECIFEVPYATSGAAGTLTQAVGDALVAKKVDLYVDTNGIQFANCSATSQALLEIVGFSVPNNTVYVKVVDAAQNQQS